jgi:tetratricopeptide (TPR) repeat protein
MRSARHEVLPMRMLCGLTIVLALCPHGGCKREVPVEAPDASLSKSNARRPSESEGRHEEPTEEVVDAYDEALRLGDAALYSGRFEVARDQFLKAMELRVDSMTPALGAIRALALEGQSEARLQIRERVEKKVSALLSNPETAGSGWLLSARLAIALRDTGRALDAARLAVAELPDMGVSWRVLGEAAMVAEQWDEAIRAFQVATAKGLEAEAGTMERLADAFDEVGNLEAAETAAQSAVEMTGKDKHARRRRLNLLAVIRKRRGDLDGAEESANAARLLGPDDPAVLHNLGSIAEARGRFEDALRLYGEAVSETPVPMTLWRMGHVELALERPEEALASFKRAAGNMDRWTWPASERWKPAYEVGRLYMRASRWGDAIGWFEDSLREARSIEAVRELQGRLAFAKLQ